MNAHENPAPTLPLALLLRVLPTAAVVGSAWVLAWNTSGSIDGSDWLPYALLCGLVLAAVLLSGSAVRPGRAAAAAVVLLAGFGAWTAVSIAWSPLPSLARDDALLACFYVVAFLTPLVTLRSSAERLAAAGLVVLGLSSLAVATILAARFAAAVDTYSAGRLNFPVSYWNGEAAMALVGFWPAIGFAASRRLHVVARMLALAGATAMLICWLLTQSKGGAVALAASAVVFFAVSPARLRALVPAVLAGAIAAAGLSPLTAPYRASDAALPGSIRHAATIGLLLTAIGVVAGLVYALADRRIRVSPLAARRIGAVLLAVLVLAALGGIGAFFAAEAHPVRFVQQKWESFKHPGGQATSSHFTSLGSNRYDFWRVALVEFEHHPLAGIGGRGWAAAYLAKGRSDEAPERAHSVELDALSETGIVGLLLLVGGGVLGFAAVRRKARTSLLGASLLASGAYFAVHTAGDWVWTIPEVGLPVFLFMGIAASPPEPRSLPRRAAVPVGIAVAAVAVIGFAPPWLSARFTNEAYSASSARARADALRWARRLDPLSVDPLLAQAALARSPADIAPLRKAVTMQPGDSEVHYLLGLAYLDAGRRVDARRQLRVALRLSPRDPAIRSALARARAPGS